MGGVREREKPFANYLAQCGGKSVTAAVAVVVAVVAVISKTNGRWERWERWERCLLHSGNSISRFYFFTLNSRPC